MTSLRTPRLLLRRWRPDDVEAFVAMNADPEVMRYLAGPMTREASVDQLARFEARFEEQGFGFWCVEVPGETSCAGFTGLNVPRFHAPFMPCVEIGWRLTVPWWGKGIATEAARAVLDHAFTTLALDEIVAFTTEANTRSRAVMERLGMTRDTADDFDHPNLPAGHALRPHVLYRARAR